jgi:hypothetical protein
VAHYAKEFSATLTEVFFSILSINKKSDKKEKCRCTVLSG